MVVLYSETLVNCSQSTQSIFLCTSSSSASPTVAVRLKILEQNFDLYPKVRFFLSGKQKKCSKKQLFWCRIVYQPYSRKVLRFQGSRGIVAAASPRVYYRRTLQFRSQNDINSSSETCTTYTDVASGRMHPVCLVSCHFGLKRIILSVQTESVHHT